MSRRRVRPLAACTLTAAALLGTAAMPALARAEDGVVDPLSSFVAPTNASPVAIADEALAVAEEPTAATEPVDSPDVPAVVADPAEAVEQHADTTVAEAPVADPASEPDPAAHHTIAPDTTPAEGDIAADTLPPAEPPAPAHETPVAEPPPAASDPPVQGTTAANINVSVRIGSPGDNGSVTQINVLGGPARTAQTDNSTTGAPAPEESERDTPEAAPTDTWYWRWDCLGGGSLGAISSFGSANGSIPSSWTWIWNCANKSRQYRDETSDGYQQINANIGIRIASPGNDGSVTQVNVARGTRLSLPAPSLPSLPVPLPQRWAPSPPALSLDLGDALGPAVTLPVPVVVGDIALPPPVSAPAVTVPSETFVHTPRAPRPSELERPSVAAHLPFGADAHLSWPAAPSAGAGGVRESATAAERELPGAAPSSTPINASGRVASHPSPELAVKKRSAPRWRPSPPHRSAPAPLSTASAAAAAGGGSPGGSGLPFLLALPFVAALLDLARRVALEHATWPSGHRRRVPDRPG